MSGGSMDYLYLKVLDAEFECNTPERRAFRFHLNKVAAALKAIEWVDSGDWGKDGDSGAILACLTPPHSQAPSEGIGGTPEPSELEPVPGCEQTGLAGSGRN